ncbi:MAG TPA: response regulator transcription factor [Gaiellaceae bacterium]|nr:response regulator transcription factor [Gaiellaceae bacterium]
MADGGRRIRVLLANEHALFREASRVVMEALGDIEVVADTGDGLTGVAEAERTRPDVAFIGRNLPGCDGIRAASLIRERVPSCRIVLVAADRELQTLVGALEAGVSGFVTNDSPFSDLVEAARAVARGETLIPKEMLGPLLGKLIRRRRVQDEALSKLDRLTRREREILALLAKGADNQSIAQELVISPETARTHIQKVLGKLDVHSRLEAAAYVMRNGILEELELAAAQDRAGRGTHTGTLAAR